MLKEYTQQRYRGHSETSSGNGERGQGTISEFDSGEGQSLSLSASGSGSGNDFRIGISRIFASYGGRTGDFMAPPRGDLRRVAVAWAVYRRTSLRQSWIADRLGLRSGDNVSAQVRKLSTRASEELLPEIQAWMKVFE